MSKCKIIDVSQVMDAFVFPKNPQLNLTGPHNRVGGKNREFVYDFRLCTQSGTHIQGPHYFLENGKRIDKYPLHFFEGEALVVDLPKRGVDTTSEDLEELLTWMRRDTEIIIFRTGNMEEIIADQEIDPSKRPGLSLDAVEYLVEKFPLVEMLAIDSIGFESRETQNHEVNVSLCTHGILLLEGLVNLSEISSRYVFLQAFPLKIRGVEGTPCRAVVKEIFTSDF